MKQLDNIYNYMKFSPVLSALLTVGCSTSDVSDPCNLEGLTPVLQLQFHVELQWKSNLRDVALN